MGSPLRKYKRNARNDRKPIKGDDGKVVNGYYKKPKKDYISNSDIYFEVLGKQFKKEEKKDE